jgi:hypothetical protein
MGMVQSNAAPPTPPEFVDNGRQTVGLDGGKPQSNVWHSYHGTSMLISFTVLMPTAIVYLRSGLPKGFQVHWILQMAAVMIAFSSAILAIIRTWGNFEVFKMFILSLSMLTQ